MYKEKRVIGKATLYLGDCMEVMTMLDKVDAVVTDPPYGINIAANPVRQKHTKKKWDSSAPIQDVIDMMFDISDEQIIWGGNYFNLPPSRGFLIWDKIQPENFSLAMCEFAWRSKDCNAKIFRKSVLAETGKQHPTQKPISLMKWCITHLPEDTNTILDPFMGSGSTGVAAVQMGREFIGIELDEDYYNIAVERIKKAQEQGDLFIK